MPNAKTSTRAPKTMSREAQILASRSPQVQEVVALLKKLSRHEVEDVFECVGDGGRTEGQKALKVIADAGLQAWTN